MSAEQFGARLLAEVEEDSLDHVLAELRQIAPPRKSSTLGISELDDLLQILCRPPAQPSLDGADWESLGLSSPGPGNKHDLVTTPGRPTRVEAARSQDRSYVIELTSSNSATGKTNILYHLTSHSILAKSNGGNEGSVVWLDTDGRFSSFRLLQIVKLHLQKVDVKMPNDLCQSLAKQALKHVHVFPIHSSTQLLAALKSLPDYLLDTSRHQSAYRPLFLVVLDSANAFHWQDRFDAEMSRLEAGGQVDAATSEAQIPKASQVISLLKAMQGKFDCAIIFTTTTTTTPSSNQYRQHQTTPNARLRPGQDDTRFMPDDSSTLVNPYTSFATVTLNISRALVPQFASEMTIQQCLRDREKRFEVVARGSFGVDMTATSESKRVTLEGKGIRSKFGVTITKAGVHID